MGTPTRGITDCKQVDAHLDAQFSRGIRALPEEAKRHLTECRRCRALYLFVSDRSISEEVPPELIERIRRQIRSGFGAVSPLPSPRVLTLRFIAVFVLLAIGIAGVMGGSPVSGMTFWQNLTITAVLSVGAILFALSLSWQMTPGSLYRISPPMVISTFLSGFLLGTAILFPWKEAERFVEIGWQCSRSGITLALPAAVLFWLLVRRGEPLSYGFLGATVGGAAGLVAVAVLQFQCVHQDALHLGVWHGGVVVVSSGLGLAAGLIYRSWRMRFAGSR